MPGIGPGGGYLLGSGNSIPDWASIENYKAMIQTCLGYGSYPICTSKSEEIRE